MSAPEHEVGPGTGGDVDVAMLMAQHGAARYADLDTINECLRRPDPGSERRAPSLDRTERGHPSPGAGTAD